MGSLNILIETEKVELESFTKPGQDKENLRRIAKYFEKLSYGSIPATVSLSSSTDNPVAASANLTVSGVTNGRTIIIGCDLVNGPLAFTARDPADDIYKFEYTGGDNATALSLTNKINAHPSIKDVIIATVSGNVINLRARLPGVAGNQFYLESYSWGTLSLDTVNQYNFEGGAGGAEGEVITISKT